MRRVHRRKRPIDYILPFLVLLSIGVIGVMAFQVWHNWNRQSEADVYFYVADGSAKVLPYGQTDWDNAFSGTKLLIGDALKTTTQGRVVIEFFNDTRVRLDNDTAVTLADVAKTSDLEMIVLHLENGSVWVNGDKSAGVRESKYEVRTPNLLVRAEGTIFEVEYDTAQVVRVFEGDVKVDIFVDAGDQERIAETIVVGVGQEITLDQATLRAFENNESPSVLKAISDEFKESQWYRWNSKEDRFPTDFSRGESSSTMEFMDTEETLDSTQETEETEEEDEGEDEDDLVNNQAGDPSAPTITSPSDTTVTEDSFVLSGTAPAGTVAIIVNSNLGDYELSAFSEGDSTWSYNVSTTIGNLEAGDNVYTAYAEDEDGNRSEGTEITITYEQEEVEVEGDLTDPEVLTFNGSESSTVTEDTVTILGSVAGAAKVVVNGYTLSQFEPGDTQWKYVASEALGNLEPGENDFEVYAVDPDGNESSVVSFTVTYEKSEEAATEDETAEEEPAEEQPETSGSQVEYGF